jgi:mycothiol synthase
MRGFSAHLVAVIPLVPVKPSISPKRNRGLESITELHRLSPSKPGGLDVWRKISNMKIEPRPFRDKHDLESMRNILIEGKKANTPIYYIHSGDLNWWLFYLERDFKHRIFLWENDAHKSVVGWTLFSPRFKSFDVFVQPGQSFLELREHLFTWAEDHLRQLLVEAGDGFLRTMWVSEYDCQLITHLESHGFVQNDEHNVYLQQALNDMVVAPELPRGYRVRHVNDENEVELRSRVSYAAFETSKPFEYYKAGYLDFMRSPVYTPELDLVVEAPGGQFVAFCICWLDDVNQVGYFEPVGTHPNFRHKGLGTAVLREGLRLMQERGMRTASVCVESDNLAAQKLYGAVGFQAMHRILTFVKRV